ncbi:MAG: C45 family autoproteolytic acyltransferase/hydrolase [Planctomycetota bacterium]|nr:C45 family autoproteolytic acyltransferase/hydrolase [Planctomycetota bacterium]
MTIQTRLSLLLLPALFFSSVAAAGPLPQQQQQSDPHETLLEVFEHVTDPMFEDRERFGYSLRAWMEGAADITEPRFERDGEAKPSGAVEISIDRTDADSFVMDVKSRWATAKIIRNSDRTILAMPEKGVVFVGEGAFDNDADTLAPEGFLRRVLGKGAPLLGIGRALAPGYIKKLELIERGRTHRFAIDDETTVAVRAEHPWALVLQSKPGSGFIDGVSQIELACQEEPFGVQVSIDGLERKNVDRAELEKMAARALRRLIQINAPDYTGIFRPSKKKVPNGELRHVGEQNLVLLRGSPEQIGKAHAQLLGEHVIHTIDSTYHLIGMAETLNTGEWFPDMLKQAWERTSKYIPERHKREMESLAAATEGVSLRDVQLANVFPEYFHCSGFALFGKATKDGTLYHGRVLDYMTLIGLQRSSVSFLIQPEDANAFFVAGYAGFIGVVSGMNDKKISLGEMGGAGRFDWDGVPMATLMRRALEECSTLQEVCDLWEQNPRTCEYYYVFADGKIRDAVGVAATPEKVEFISPGAFHPQLGEGIPDAVVLSAGSRLALLRDRVRKGYGEIDEQAALRLMDRPVSMESNLHNTLFVPEKGIVWVANASDDQPAAERPYVKYDVLALAAELASRPIGLPRPARR